MPSISYNGSPPYYPFDLIYYILFDRGGMFQFDALTFLVFYIDGFDWKKRVPSTLVLHWALRSLGACVYGTALYICQNMRDEDIRAPVGWKWTFALPSIFWYIGELFLDSYPFQKALAIAAFDKPVFKIIPYVGYLPLVFGKLGMSAYRMIYPFYAPNYTQFVQLCNYLDAVMILLSAWSDLLNCLVIVYLGSKSLKLSRSKFLVTLVTATELRMFASTFLAVTSAVLLFMNEDCITYGQNCMYSNARNLAISVAYSLYYLDYLAIKFFDISHTNKNLTRSLRHLGVNPDITSFDSDDTDSSGSKITPIGSATSPSEHELKKPSKLILRPTVVRTDDSNHV